MLCCGMCRSISTDDFLQALGEKLGVDVGPGQVRRSLVDTDVLTHHRLPKVRAVLLHDTSNLGDCHPPAYSPLLAAAKCTLGPYCSSPQYLSPPGHLSPSDTPPPPCYVTATLRHSLLLLACCCCPLLLPAVPCCCLLSLLRSALLWWLHSVPTQLPSWPP